MDEISFDDSSCAVAKTHEHGPAHRMQTVVDLVATRLVQRSDADREALAGTLEACKAAWKCVFSRPQATTEQWIERLTVGGVCGGQR